MSDKIEISKQEYLRLRYNEELLARLKRGGVDSWEGHDKSIEPDAEPSMFEYNKYLKKELGL